MQLVRFQPLQRTKELNVLAGDISVSGGTHTLEIHGGRNIWCGQGRENCKIDRKDCCGSHRRTDLNIILNDIGYGFD